MGASSRCRRGLWSRLTHASLTVMFSPITVTVAALCERQGSCVMDLVMVVQAVALRARERAFPTGVGDETSSD